MTTPKEALEEAINIIRIFHGEAGWDIYYKEAPEMQRIKAAIPVAELHEQIVNLAPAGISRNTTAGVIRRLLTQLEAMK